MRLSDLKYIPELLRWYFEGEYDLAMLDCYLERSVSERSKCSAKTFLKLIWYRVMNKVFGE